MWWRRRMRPRALLQRHARGPRRLLPHLGASRARASAAHGAVPPRDPIRRHELDERGPWFVDRLCDPYVTGAELRRASATATAKPRAVPGGDGARERRAQVPAAALREETRFGETSEFATEEALLASDAFKIRDGSPDWRVEETRAMRAEFCWRCSTSGCLLRGRRRRRVLPRASKRSARALRRGAARDALAWLMDDYFNRRQETLWRERARRVLPALTECTGQLVCGEDLGMVPRACSDLGGPRHPGPAHPAHAARRAFGRVREAGDLRARHGVLAELPRHHHHARVVRGGRGAAAALRERGAGDVRRRVPPPPSTTAPRRVAASGSRVRGARAAAGACTLAPGRTPRRGARAWTAAEARRAACRARSTSTLKSERASRSAAIAEVQKREPPLTGLGERSRAVHALGDARSKVGGSTWRATPAWRCSRRRTCWRWRRSGGGAACRGGDHQRPTNNRHYWRFERTCAGGPRERLGSGWRRPRAAAWTSRGGAPRASSPERVTKIEA